MLEIFFLVRFARHLAKLAKEKGRSGGWGGLGVGLWFFGEITGFIVGAVADAGAASYLVAPSSRRWAQPWPTLSSNRWFRRGDPALAGAPGGAGAFAPHGPPDLTNPYSPPRAQ